jgi:beta-phosphoglucomutase-like phosphatase (HAD superfamily)
MTDIKAILFDMDGVLIEAKDWHYDALNRALDCFGMAIQRDEHLAVYDGLPTRKKLELLSASRGLPRPLHTFLNDLKQRYTMEIAYSRCRPVFQHQYALSRLRHDGYRLCVCSNSIRATVELLMRLSALDNYIEFYMSNEDVSRPKPDPEIYSTAIQKLALAPTNCLIIEDNEHGIRAARASGAHVMTVSGTLDVSYARIRQQIQQIEQVQP